MPRAYFLLYRKDDRIGNDLSLKEPFRWLLENRNLYPDSYIAIESWSNLDVPQSEWNLWDSQIGIDVDETLLLKKKQAKEKAKIPEEPPEKLKVEPGLSKEEQTKQRRIEALKKAREAKKNKNNKSVLGTHDIRK